MTARKPKPAESWDAFWAEVSGDRKEEIRGVVVTVPTDIPLALEQRISELRDSTREEDLDELISLLFGVDALSQWRENGMGAREFKTVFAWGVAHADGRDISFAEALELVRKEEAEGKAPAANRSTRRATASAKPSGSTGGRSKRISSGSTGSARTRSQR